MSYAIDYPPDLPMDSIKDVIRILRSGPAQIITEKALFGKQVWITQGYFQNVLLGNTPPLPGVMALTVSEEVQGETEEAVTAPFPQLTDEQLAHALESTFHKVDPSVQAARLPIPVQIILENLVRRGLEVLLNKFFPGVPATR